MRNLKRALSLVLAVVMVIGLMVVGASAVSYNDFSDREEIVNKDAVSMLTTLEIIQGLPDGSYDPTGNVDRAQMAKMISVTLTNNQNCDTLYTNVDSGLTDIAANWARGFINYCYVRGIIAGRGDNTFDPSANVTGVEAAKMLLAALGYNAEIEGLVGPDWALNTAALAQQLGIFRNFTKDVSEPLSRDDAALLIYNALDVEMIQQYSNGYALVYADHRTILSSVFGVVRVEGVVTANEWARLEETDSDAALRTGKTTLDEVVVYDSTTSNTTVPEGVKEDDPVTFNVTTPVEYIGKAVTMYVEKTTILANSNVIGVATNDEANVIHATTATEENLDDLLDGTGIETDKNTQYYVNYGWCEDGATEAVTLINKYANEDLGETNTYYNVNGVDVEVIDNNDDGTAEYVLYVQDTLSEVTRYSERNETVSFYIPELENDGTPSQDVDTLTRDFEDVVFNDEVATDDLILYVEYGGRTYIQLAPIVTEAMYRVDRDRNNEQYITLDNEQEYRQAYLPDAASMADVELTHFNIDEARTELGFDTTYDFILDASEQYVIATRPAEETVTNYALVLESAWTQNALDRDGQVKILMADGTEGTYYIDWDESAKAFARVSSINGDDTYTPAGSPAQDIEDLPNDTKLELYLGSRDVHNVTGQYGVNSAEGSVITYTLDDDDVLTIESVMQGNSFTADSDEASTPLQIHNANTTRTTAGVGDNGVILYLGADPDDDNLQYNVGNVAETAASGYENGNGTITVHGVNNGAVNDPDGGSGISDDLSDVSRNYAVDLNTVAFYYWIDDEGDVRYGVATGWDDMSDVAAGTDAQVYPVLERTTNRTYQASDLAGLILFEAANETDSSDYMLVLDANANRRGDIWTLTVVFEDGTVAAIEVEEDNLGDFEVDNNNSYGRAWSYSENADGTYDVGSMYRGVDTDVSIDGDDASTGRGVAHRLENGTIAFTDEVNSRQIYAAILGAAQVWDVNDVENAGDEATASAFSTRTDVNAVVIFNDSGSIRTAWIWDRETPTTPDVDFDTDTELVDVVVDDNASGRRLITIEYTGEEPSTSDLRTLITDELLGYYNKNVNGESVDVEITRFDADEQSVTARVTKTNGGINTEKWYYEFVNDVASSAVGSDNKIVGYSDTAATWTVNGNTLTADFGSKEYSDADHSFITNDVSRFLGALYHQGHASQIKFDGVTYVWDDDAKNASDKPVKGSAWYDASDNAYNGDSGSQNTLVSAIFGQIGGWTFPENGEIVLYVDGVKMTINLIATEAAGA